MRRPERFEIVNEIDPYSITSDSPVHAAAAVVLLSKDAPLALRRREGPRRGEVVVPPFHGSGEAGLSRWWSRRPESRDEPDFWAWCERELRGIADALETVRLEAPSPTCAADLIVEARNLARDIRRKIAEEART